MQKIYLMIAFLALGAFTITSCGKKGCTDSNATNYDSEAKKDDGSCLYEGKVVFWYNKATEDSLYNRGMYSYDLYFTVDGKQLEDEFGDQEFSFSATPNAPDCPSSSLWDWNFTSNPGKRLDLGSSSSKNVNYKVVDEYGEVIFEGTKTVQANTCNDIQLKF